MVERATPKNQVFLIKKVLPLITELEKEIISSSIKKNKSIEHFIIDAKKEFITIYTALLDPIFKKDPLLAHIISLRNIKPNQLCLNYMETIRFKLVNQTDRIFTPERFCSRGSINDWISIGDAGKLNELAMKYIQHINNDSFYGLGLY